MIKLITDKTLKVETKDACFDSQAFPDFNSLHQT